MDKRTFLKLSSFMMAGSALSPLAGFAQNEKITNWAGNYTYGTSSVFHAGSLEEARGLIVKNQKLKVLGTRHCFNNIADSHHHFLSLAQLNRVVAMDGHTVTVESGVKYGELAVMLNDKGYALHNLASLPHISVAGGCATATHGSGVHNGNLSSAVGGQQGHACYPAGVPDTTIRIRGSADVCAGNAFWRDNGGGLQRKSFYGLAQ